MCTNPTAQSTMRTFLGSRKRRGSIGKNIGTQRFGTPARTGKMFVFACLGSTGFLSSVTAGWAKECGGRGE